MIEPADWDAVYREMIADGRRKLGEPPTDDELAAYSRGELPATEAARIQDLLVIYPDLLRAMETPFGEPAPGEPGGLSAVELEDDWVALRARVAPSAAVLPFPSRPPRLWKLSATLAALLAVAFGGLYLQEQREVRRLMQELAAPRLNPEPRVLLPDGQRGGGQSPILLSPPAAEGLLLTPLLTNGTGPPDLRLELLEETGTEARPIWSTAAPRRSSENGLQISVPRAFLRHGLYQLRIYGRAAGTETLLATYTIRISE